MSERDEPRAGDAPAVEWHGDDTAEPPAIDGSLDITAAAAPDPSDVAALGPAPDPVPSADRPEPTFAWTPELASGHAPGEAPPTPPSGRPVLDLIVWFVGIVIALGFAVVIAGLQARSAPASAFEGGRRAGEIAGEVLAAFLLAFLVWAAIVWISRRRGRVRRLASPVVPLIAILFLGVAFVGVASKSGNAAVATGPSASQSTTHSIDQVLAIHSPYRLEVSPAEEERQFLDLFTGGQSGTFKSVAVRRIYEGADLVGYALVADADVEVGQEAVAMLGVEIGLGTDDVTKAHTSVAGHDVISGTAGGAGFTVWIEAPFVKMVFATQERDARDISASFFAE